jgi:hypothetical protein
MCIFYPLASFRKLVYRDCRCAGFSADSRSHNSHQLRVTAARSPNQIRKLLSHVQRQATSSSKTSLSLLFIQFSTLERERGGTVREGVWARQITTDNRQLRPARRHTNRLSSACQHNSKSNEWTEMLILSRNLHGGSVLAIHLSCKYNTHVVPADPDNHNVASRANTHRHQQVDQRVRCCFYNPVDLFRHTEIEKNFMYAAIQKQSSNMQLSRLSPYLGKTTCSLGQIYWRFGGTCFFKLGFRASSDWLQVFDSLKVSVILTL